MTPVIAKWHRQVVQSMLDQVGHQISSPEAKKVLDAYRSHIEMELAKAGHGDRDDVDISPIEAFRAWGTARYDDSG